MKCRLATVDAVRLACFDRVTDPANASKPAQENVSSPAASASAWLALTETSSMTDDTNHFVSVQSESFQQCRQYGNTGPITLTARCLEDTTAIMIHGDCHLASGFSGYGEVTWRTDEDKPTTRQFEASTDSSALGLWSGRQSIPAIKELFGKERLVVRFMPFGMSPVEATFDISGLEEAIGPLREECGW